MKSSSILCNSIIPFLGFFLIQKYTSSQSCISFGDVNTIGHACYGAVDYAYYLAANYTADQYNSIAISNLNSLKLSILPVSCQIGIKKLVCSQVYMKCPTDINLTSSTYYNWNINIYTDIYTQLSAISAANPYILTSPFIPMPFQRPCQSICTDLSSQCLGLLGLLGLNQNCTARYDYSRGALSTLYTYFPSLTYPYQYDASNDQSKCNAMTATFSVASTKEVYLKANDPTGACYGITKELYIPPGQSVSTILAPLQFPYVVQSIIESTLTASFSALPVYLSKSCHLAFKKYFCGSYMLSPQQQVVGRSLQAAGLNPTLLSYLVSIGSLQSDLLTYSFYLPSYPHSAICLEYQTACADFIEAAGLASLVPNCSAVSSSGVKSFPSANQTLLSLPLTVGSTTVTVSFTSSPNLMSSASTSSFTTTCPSGYVVPEKPEDNRIIWVTGSGCALACRSNLWTKSEWRIVNTLSTVLAWLGFFMVFFLLITLLWDEQRKKQFLVFYFALFSSSCTLSFVVSTVAPHDLLYCASNAVPYDNTDPPNFAQAQAIILIVCGIGTTACWFMLAFDLFLKVGLGIRSTAKYKLMYLSFIAIVTLGCTLYGGIGAKYGFIGILPISMVWRDHKGDLIALYTPMLIMAFGGGISMVVVLISIIRSIISTSTVRRSSMTRRTRSKIDMSSSKNIIGGSGETPSSSRSGTISLARLVLVHNISMLKIPILFLLSYSILILTYQIWRYNFITIIKNATAGLVIFTTCIFTHFDGSDESWRTVCGEHSDGRPNFAVTCWVFACVSGESILISMIYLSSPSIWKFWATKLWFLKGGGRSGNGNGNPLITRILLPTTRRRKNNEIPPPKKAVVFVGKYPSLQKKQYSSVPELVDDRGGGNSSSKVSSSKMAVVGHNVVGQQGGQGDSRIIGVVELPPQVKSIIVKEKKGDNKESISYEEEFQKRAASVVLLG